MMRTVLLLLVAAQWTSFVRSAVIEYKCPPITIFSEDCPLQVTTPDGTTICVKLVTTKSGWAYSRIKAQTKCQELGQNGHLANIYDEDEFKKVRCYMIEQTDVARSRDPKVLLGMRYNLETGDTLLYSGEVQSNSYWGAEKDPFSYGTDMIMRASRSYIRSKLFNFGGGLDTRYERFLCEWKYEK